MILMICVQHYATPVIPGKKNHVVPVEYDHVIYKERIFAKIKQFRPIASRFDKTSVMFIGALTLVSILMWLEI